MFSNCEPCDTDISPGERLIERDAVRYQWLRRCATYGWPDMTGPELDAFIDGKLTAEYMQC